MRTVWIAFLLCLASAPAQSAQAQSDPAQSAATPTGASEIHFPSDGLTIPGTLQMPAGEPPVRGVPIVVLVHGSGPNDRDETIGPNKIFADLANDLAAHGIATLRYDKRTYLWQTGKARFEPGDDLKLTLGQEVVDDAVAALSFASAQPGIDRKRVFLLGHSLGGMLAPRIAAERMKAAPDSLRGIVEMAAEAVPPGVLLPLQVAFQAMLRGQSLADAEAGAENTSTMFKDALNPSADLSRRIQFGSVGYLKEWSSVDAAGGLKALGLPALVLRGQKDVQVTYQDYVLLARAAINPGSRTLELPGLNHLFMEVKGESTGDEYTLPGHVAPVLAERIAAWMSGLPQ